MLSFTDRFLAALAVASAAIVLVPIGARSQQAAADPVTTAPANQVTAGGELEKVTVNKIVIPRVPEVVRNRSLPWTRTLLRNSPTKL